MFSFIVLGDSASSASAISSTIFFVLLFTAIGSLFGWIFNRVVDFLSRKIPYIYWLFVFLASFLWFFLLKNLATSSQFNSDSAFDKSNNFLFMYMIIYFHTYFLIPIVDGQLEIVNVREYYYDGSFRDYVEENFRPGFWRKSIIQSSVAVVICIFYLIFKSQVVFIIPLIIALIASGLFFTLGLISKIKN